MSEEKKGFNLGDFATKITKGNKIAGIIIAIAILIIGILLFIAPVRSLIAIEYFVAAALLVFGIYRIIAYAKTPQESKNSMALISAILMMIIAIILLALRPLAMETTFAFLFAFMTMITGVNRLTAAGAVKKAGGAYGWCIASGIINIVLSIFFICTPIMTGWIFGVIAGIYLTIAGLVFLIDVATAKTK